MLVFVFVCFPDIFLLWKEKCCLLVEQLSIEKYQLYYYIYFSILALCRTKLFVILTNVYVMNNVTFFVFGCLNRMGSEQYMYVPAVRLLLTSTRVSKQKAAGPGGAQMNT